MQNLAVVLAVWLRTGLERQLEMAQVSGPLLPTWEMREFQAPGFIPVQPWLP